MREVFKFQDRETAEQTLWEALQSDDWYALFCTDRRGEVRNFYLCMELVRMLSSMFPFGGFNDEEEMKELLHEALIARLDEIVDWLMEPVRKPLAFRCVCKSSVGYIALPNGENSFENVPTNAFTFRLRKDSISGERGGFMPYGFTVNSFHPCE